MKKLILVISTGIFSVSSVLAQTFTFSTGTPDGRLGTASRPESVGKIEIESADDFVITAAGGVQINSATFTGLIVSTGAGLPTLGQVDVEIYRVFPLDSDVGRTSGPPTFSTPLVPTRVNSPSDTAFDTRFSTGGGGLTFTTTELSPTFTAANSILNGIIKPMPNPVGGEGAITGREFQFNITFTNPFNLPADHYFFVPQVQVTGGEFYWLSAARPIVPPGTSFPAGSTDLQAWIRNANLDPDWLREGTDIIGGTTFNEAFTLNGVNIPDSGSTLFLFTGAAALLLSAKRRMLSKYR